MNVSQKKYPMDRKRALDKPPTVITKCEISLTAVVYLEHRGCSVDITREISLRPHESMCLPHGSLDCHGTLRQRDQDGV